jgi:enterochelin esterase family protein
MRSWLTSLFVLAVVLGAAGNRSVRAGELHALSVPSAALGRDLPVYIYEPAPEVRTGQRLPVLYLLHGVGGHERDWADAGHLDEILDRAIAAGEVPPMFVVMPDGGNSWYVNNPDPGGAGAMAEALSNDLPAFIDSHLPTLACRQGRAIAGVSMGGYGALLQAMDHPAFFAAAFTLSAALWAPMPEDEAERAKRPTRMFRGAFGTPLDWQRFNAQNVFPRLDAYARDPNRTPFHLAVGSEDFPNLQAMNHRFVDILAEKGVSVPLKVDQGAHEWKLWSAQLPAALRWLAPRLASHC